MISFKLASFGKGKAIQKVSSPADVSLAEVLEEYGYSLNAQVKANGVEIDDIGNTIGDLNLDGKMVYIVGEVKTSGASEEERIKELEAQLSALKTPESVDCLEVPKPIINYAEGSEPQYCAEPGMQLFTRVDQFLEDGQKVTGITDTDGEVLSPYAEVEAKKQYVITIK